MELSRGSQGIRLECATPVRQERQEGGDFVLDNFFRRNYHTSFNHSERNWTMLKFPVHHGSGLTALDCLGYLGFGPNDERMDKPIRWLMSMRKSDGFWYRSMRPHHLDDQWITVTALAVLSALLEKLLAPPQWC